jgi:fused signal recognition particle receptor
MFGKLKDKLKSALSVFTKKAEEEAEVKQITIEKEIPPEPTAKKVSEHTPSPEAEKIIHKVQAEFKEEEKQKERKKFQEKLKEKEAKAEEQKKEEIPTDVVKITYFVHGTTLDNEKGVSSGWSDVELSEKGVQQSLDLTKQIKDKHFDVVFCSDLKRAVHSAELTFKGKVKIVQDKRLRECNYGKYNAHPSEVVEPLQEKSVHKKFPQGESYEDVRIRITEFLNFLYTHYCGKHVAIVAHKAPQLVLDVLLSGKSWKQAFAEDWRIKKQWQPGWDYFITKKITLTEESRESSFDDEEEEEKEEEQIIPEASKKELKVEEIEPEERKGFFKRLFGKKEEATEEKKEEPEIVVEPLGKKEAEKPQEEPEEKKGFFQKVKQTLTTKTISASKFEDLFWELELALLENNVSVEVIEKIKDDLKKELVDKPLPRDVESVIEETLKKTLQEILTFKKVDLLSLAKHKKPLIIAFFGVNGAGKTTSIAKLTYYLQQHNLSVVLAACDTFRAAAIQQLEEHADRLKVKMIKHDYGSDAAAVAYDAVKYAEKNKIDVVLIDTAGRLHSNTNLMQELEKIIRVTKPDIKLFVGESITGNDCIEQAREFNSLVEMDGTILTKADVDEKGGAPLSIAYTIKKPILFLGMGQEYKDLEEFSAEKILERLGL